MVRNVVVVAASLTALALATPARAQTTYYLHSQASSTTGLEQLTAVTPSTATVAFQTVDLKSHGAEDGTIASFDTQAGVPGVGGIIPANSTLTFNLQLRKTAALGTVFPRVSAGINWGGPTLFCSGVNGSTAITSTTAAQFAVNCSTGSTDITLLSTDRIWITVGYHMTAGPGNKSMKVELDVEGTTSPSTTDSRVSVPNAAGPTISSVSPNSAPPTWPVTLSGTFFGGTQGTGTVKFGGTTASITSWNTTTIQTQVPAGLAVGSTTVAVTTATGRQTSASFTVLGPPTLTSVTPAIGHIGDSVTIAGTNFMSTQSSSSVSFNGTAGAPTAWGTGSITVPVPSGATSGNLQVTVAGQPSNTLPFSVIAAPTITSSTPSSGQIGATVTVTGTNFGSTQGTSTIKFNGTTATATFWSNTAITTTVPSGATTGNIVVTVSGQASNGRSFSVVSPGTMSGTVTRATGGSAISGASVQAMLAGVVKGSATTPANGTYSIAGLDPGTTYEVWTTATGFSTDVKQGITVTASTTTTVNVAMAAPGSVSGRITQNDGVTPIVGASVSVYSGSTQTSSANTNGTGDYAISGLKTGSYTVRAANPSYRTKEQSASVTENNNTVVNLSLDPMASGTINYVYDELGRLVQVTDQAGDSATYEYDLVGNLLKIVRGSTTATTIGEFTPNSGPVGTSVTVYGTGFSATPSQNTVTFGATAATVTSATTTTLVVTAPASGAISVTSPNGSATSVDSFTVAASPTPTISGFTPAIATAGTSLSVTGTNFDTDRTHDRTAVNNSLAYVSAATTTTLTALVPSAGSGPIMVATPLGSAVSATDLFIPPSPFVATDVQYTGRIAFGGGANAVTVTISTATKIGLVTFAATAGQRISLLGTNGISGQIFGCDVNVSIYKPDNTPLVGQTCMEQSGFVDATTIPTTGTYTILVDPTDNATGSLTLALYTFTDLTDSIAIGGPAVTKTTTTPGQNAYLTFSGTSGQRVSVWGTNGLSGQIFGCDVNVSVIRVSDNTTIASPVCMEQTGFIDPFTLPTTGSYQVFIDPVSGATGSLTVALYNPTDFTGSIATDGTPVTASIGTPGQNAYYTFTTTTTNQRVSVNGTNGTIAGEVAFTCDVNVSIVDSTGTTTYGGPVCMEGSGFLDTITLATPGNYRVFVDPNTYATGNLTLALYTVSDVAGTITADGTPITASISTPGQNGFYSFSTTVSNQRVSLNGTNGTMAGQVAFTCDVNVSIVDSTGATTYGGPVCMEGSGFLDTITLATIGTYKVFVNPNTYVTGNLTLALYTVTDVSGTITADGTPITASIGTPGQNAYYSFTTTVSNQRVSLDGSNGTMAGQVAFTCDVNVSIVDSGGTTTYGGPVCMEGSGFLDTITLATIGTYKVFVDPNTYVTGNLTLKLFTVPADLTGTLTVNASATPVTISTPGQNASYTFTLASSQAVTVRVTNNTFAATSPCVTVSLVGGSNPSSASCGSGFNLTQQTLGAGTYTVNIDPSGNSTGSLSIQVTSP